MSIWKICLILLLIPLTYVIGCIIYAKMTYFDPPQVEVIATNEGAPKISQQEFTASIWNLGYAGLGAKSDFFYDGGQMTRPEEKDIHTYFDGIMEELRTDSSDFVLLQEVDHNSKRSYYLDQVSFIQAQAHALQPFSYFAKNYQVNYIPQPWTDPMGKVESGLLTLSKYVPYKVVRHQLPGEFGFPKQLFFLRRCLLVFHYHLSNGKDFVLINIHNSAYDDSGKLKKQEMDYLRTFLAGEDKKGNYIICGGDWNQCPPSFHYDQLAKGKQGDYFQTNVDQLTDGGIWDYDSRVATNRKNDKPYTDKTFTTIIDFFWMSKNITPVQCKGKNLNFKDTDHQPVHLTFKLN